MPRFNRLTNTSRRMNQMDQTVRSIESIRVIEPIRTIDEIALMVSDGIDLNDISRILFTLIENAERFKLSGYTKKQIVMFALNALREKIPEDKKDEYDFIVLHGSNLIDSIVSIANSVIFRKVKKDIMKRKKCLFC